MKVQSIFQRGGVTAAFVELNSDVQPTRRLEMQDKLRLVGAFTVGTATVAGALIAAFQFFIGG